MIGTDILDEIVTPGCANCAVKHMSAAIAFSALDRMAGTDGFKWPAYEVFEARALINAVEFLEGYDSHFDFAVGLLELAEESACEDGFSANAIAIRKKRVKLMSSRSSANVVEFIKSVPRGCDLMCVAHVGEAIRELPADEEFAKIAREGLKTSNKTERCRAFAACIARVREMYFPSETNEEEKGGEEVMGMCAKKNAGSTKAVKAACKGGKCKKAACKGGKCKK